MNLIKIPRNIFQTWETKDLSDGFKLLTQTWKDKNTNYSYFLFDNNDCIDFIKKHFDEKVYNAYSRIIPGAFKADLWRYCVLYIYGGIYVDIDTVCLGKVDSFLNEDIEFMTPIDLNNCPNIGTHNLFNCFIASIPNHPILLNCINRIVYNVENNIVPFSNLDFTGPGILGRSTNVYLNFDQETSFIGREGIYKNTIYLLNFDYGTEYVRDKNNNILFQNKNGNETIQEIYNNEIKKIDHIDWGKCKNPIKQKHVNNDTIVSIKNQYTLEKEIEKEIKKEIEVEYDTLFDYNIDLFKVYQFDKKIRFGSNIDGGYVFCDINTKYDCYISGGIADNDDFTYSFINKYNISKKNCYGFDGTVNKLPDNIFNDMTFIKKNIGNMNNNKVTNLDDLFEKYNDIFLKMDIEGGEWEWLSYINEQKLNKISQFVIELHGVTNVSWHNNMTFDSFNCSRNEKIKCLEKLFKTHFLVHAHGNNADKIAYNGIPNVIELTYVHKKHFDGIPELNTTPLPIIGLDYPNEKKMSDVDLNFFPFVHNLPENPFLINIQDKSEYTNDDYIDIQNQLNNKNINGTLESLYTQKNNFYDLSDFKSRITKGITQKIIDMNKNSIPTKNLYKIGNGGNNRNCIVCCTPFTRNLDKVENDSRYKASQQINKSLQETGFNGYLYLFNGGFPNPTGTEMKYIGVPYCFKIFMMLEALKVGFDKVIWIDSACFAINNPQPLFDILYKQDTVIKKINKCNNYDAMVLENTLRLLNQITKCDLHNASYIETIVFGLNMQSEIIKDLINEYYDMVKLGWPFFSIFPEEIVFSALFNKPKYKSILHDEEALTKLNIHERKLDEKNAREKGYFFHHKEYKTNKSDLLISFDNNGGRFGNQLFCYLISKLFTIRFGHRYVSRDVITNDNYINISEANVQEYLENKYNIHDKHIVLNGFFQKSDLFINYRSELINLIYDKNNHDYWYYNNTVYYVKDYLINSKHNINLKTDDVVVSLRLNDFIQYPCKTSDIIPPQYYIDILEKMSNIKSVYIVCDKLTYDWEFKYIEFFKKWNPKILQESLTHDIALMRDSNILIHSNSSLCWIVSFLSYKSTRIIPYTPKIYMNQNQSLNKITDTDILNYVTPLDHNEVHELDVNDTSVFPLSFSVPDECIVDTIPKKTTLLASLIPGDMTTYIYDKYKEKEYNEMYRSSRFAITKMKGGWDCLRHYEILMNGCVPLFENLNECPSYTLTTYPKELNDEAYELYNNWIENEEHIEKYNTLCLKYLEHTKKYCTTSYTSEYLLKNIKNGDKVKNVLLITCHHGNNYNRESLWIGLKRYIKSINGVAVEHEKLPFLYDDFDNFSEHKYYSNNCFTYPKRLQKDNYYNMNENEIVEKINNKFWDLIIYGKVGPDEFCTFPFFDIVKSNYNKNKLVFIFGGDEIFNLKITDENSYHINMFNRAIYYKPYSDYLNYYKQFGTCFVRELEK